MLAFIILVIISFFGTYYVMPHSIRKLREANYVVKDMYKLEKPEIPTNAGIIIVFTSFISICILPLTILLINFSFSSSLQGTSFADKELALLLVVSIYAFYGLVDDLVDVGRKMKFLLPIIFSFPLISLIRPDSLSLLIYQDLDLNKEIYPGIDFSDVFRLIIVPTYVMVVANLFNMHSGYNGLQSGLSILVIGTLIFKSYLDNKLDDILVVGAFFGSMIAFWFFNKYPSLVFEGNVGSLLFGSIAGCIIVIQHYWWFGFFILIPHTFNFLLWIIWLILMKRNPQTYLEPNGLHKKFASVNEDLTINPPNILTLKWFLPFFFKINEKQGTIYMYLLSFIFCACGVIIF